MRCDEHGTRGVAKALCKPVTMCVQGDGCARSRPLAEASVDGRSKEQMDYRILGPLEVHDGGRLIRLGGAKLRALIAISCRIASRWCRPTDRSTVSGAESVPAAAVRTLQAYVSRLCRPMALGPPAGSRFALRCHVILTEAQAVLVAVLRSKVVEVAVPSPIRSWLLNPSTSTPRLTVMDLPGASDGVVHVSG